MACVQKLGYDTFAMWRCRAACAKAACCGSYHRYHETVVARLLEKLPKNFHVGLKLYSENMSDATASAKLVYTEAFYVQLQGKASRTLNCATALCGIPGLKTCMVCNKSDVKLASVHSKRSNNSPPSSVKPAAFFYSHDGWVHAMLMACQP